MGIPEKVSPQHSLSARVGIPSSGWDPYEVWRTRVLLPRLSDEARHPAMRMQAVTTFEVVPASSLLADKSPVLEASVELEREHEALQRELIDVTGWLLIVGLASTFLTYTDQQRPR